VCRVGVELEHGLGVLQVIGPPEANEALRLAGDKGLDTVGLDDTANIRVGDDGTGEEVAILEGGGLVSCSEDGVELVESSLSPDDEATKVTSGGKEQEVQGRNASHLNTSQISESSLGGGSLVANNDEGTDLDLLSSVPQAGLARVLFHDLASLNVCVSLELGQEGESELSLGKGLDCISSNNQGNFRNGRDVVSASHHEGGHSRGSQGGGNGVSLLVNVHLAVPPSPGASGCEHSSTSAHVTEGSLSSAVCATTRDTGNTSHGSTSTPRSSRCLCTCPLRNRVGHSAVLAKVGLNILNYVISNGCIQHGRGSDLRNHLTIPAVYLNQWA